MMLQFSEIIQSRVFDGTKLESEHHFFVLFYRHLEKKMVVAISDNHELLKHLLW